MPDSNPLPRRFIYNISFEHGEPGSGDVCEMSVDLRSFFKDSGRSRIRELVDIVAKNGTPEDLDRLRSALEAMPREAERDLKRLALAKCRIAKADAEWNGHMRIDERSKLPVEGDIEKALKSYEYALKEIAKISKKNNK